MRREVAHLTGEEEYCRRLDAESLRNMQRRSELEQQSSRAAEASALRQTELDRQRALMTKTLGVDDVSVLHKVQDAGYSSATASLVYLLPSVWVAWVDKLITSAERRFVLELATSSGMQPLTPAFDELTDWLEQKPSDEFLQASWSALLSVLHALPNQESDARKDTILHQCRTVAGVSGQGLSRICAAERRLLAEMERELMLQSELPAAAGFP